MAVLTLVGLFTFGVKPSVASAPKTVVLEYIEVKSENIKKTKVAPTKAIMLTWVDKYAEMYGVSSSTMKAVIICESNFSPEAYGDSGKAHGLAQFWLGTFNAFKKEAGLNLDYHNPEHQVRLLAWGLANGKGSHWTCFRNLVK